MHAFRFEMREMCAFYFEMLKTADFRSNMLVSWELVTEDFQGRPVKFAHFTHFNEMRDRKIHTN